MKKGLNRGFTLIELLVVIAIIGILSSVILASLNSAREKGSDAAVKQNLASLRGQAELFYDTGQTYTNLCTDAKIVLMHNAAKAAGRNTGTCTTGGTPAGSTWMAWSSLKKPLYAQCVDNTGNSKEMLETAAAALGAGGPC